MPHRSHGGVLCWLVFAVGLGAAVAAADVPQDLGDPTVVSQAARCSISGAWTLNPALSDSLPTDDVPQDQLLVTLSADTVTFYQRDGSWQVYRLSGRRERRDLGSGPVSTIATWDGSTLRLQIEGARGLRFAQRFSVAPPSCRLVVVTSPDSRRLPLHAVRLVYDAVIDRTP